MPNLDEFDARILNELQRDGRIAVVDLAEHVHLSPTACHKRIKRLEETGVIAGYAAILGTRALGFEVEAFIAVVIEQHVKAAAVAFKSAVSKLSGVRNCYMLAGEFDFLIQVVMADLDAYTKFIMNEMTTLPGVKAVRTSFILDTSHSTNSLPVHQFIASRPAE